MLHILEMNRITFKKVINPSFSIIENSKMTCPRCIKIVKHAESLITNVQLGEVQDVLGVCDHCLLKERLRADSYCRCKEIEKKFTTNAKEKKEAQKNRVKRWLTQVQHLLKNASIDDSKRYKLKERARSELSFDKLFHDFSRSEPKYYADVSRAEEKMETSTQLLNTPRTSPVSEIVEEVLTNTKAYLKRVTKSVKHREISEPSFVDFPQDKQTDDIPKPGFSKSKDRQLVVSKLGKKKIEHEKFTSFLEKSEGYFETKPRHKKLSILKMRKNEKIKIQENKLNAVSEEDVSTLGKTQEFITKSKTFVDVGLIPSLEKQTSLSPVMPWIKSLSEDDLSRNFSFYFPREKKEIIGGRSTRISSAEIIKDLQDTLNRKAEAEQRKKDEERKKKREEKERIKLEKAERRKIEAERKLLAHEEKKWLTEKTPLEKVDEVTDLAITTDKAQKKPQVMSKDQISTEEKEQKREEKQEKLQKQKLGDLEVLQEGKRDKTQKQKLEGDDKLKREKDYSKQDEEESQIGKSKIAEGKIAQKGTQKVLKERQKGKEEQVQKTENEKKIEDKESKKQQKVKGNSLEKDANRSTEADSDRKNMVQKDESIEKDKLTQKDVITKKDNVSQKDEISKKEKVTKKDEITKKDNGNREEERAKKGERTKKDETMQESRSDKKSGEDRETQRAANDELKALLALQEKDKAESEKLKKQEEIERERADRKVMQAEKMSKEAKPTGKYEKNKEVKDMPVNSEDTTPIKSESPPPPRDLDFIDVKVKRQSGDDQMLHLIKSKQNEPRLGDSYRFPKISSLPDIAIKTHARQKCKGSPSPKCRNSEVVLDHEECLIAAADTYKPEEITNIIIGEKIYKNTTPYRKQKEKETKVEFIDETEVTATVKKQDEVVQEMLVEAVPTKQLKIKNDLVSLVIVMW